MGECDCGVDCHVTLAAMHPELEITICGLKCDLILVANNLRKPAVTSYRSEP